MIDSDEVPTRCVNELNSRNGFWVTGILPIKPRLTGELEETCWNSDITEGSRWSTELCEEDNGTFGRASS